MSVNVKHIETSAANRLTASEDAGQPKSKAKPIILGLGQLALAGKIVSSLGYVQGSLSFDMLSGALASLMTNPKYARGGENALNLQAMKKALKHNARTLDRAFQGIDEDYTSMSVTALTEVAAAPKWSPITPEQLRAIRKQQTPAKDTRKLIPLSSIDKDTYKEFVSLVRQFNTDKRPSNPEGLHLNWKALEDEVGGRVSRTAIEKKLYGHKFDR